jgi:hypothetical protein
MKRFFILLGIALLVGSAALYADESVLIDFNKLAADIVPVKINDKDVFTENRATMMDFSVAAGSTFTGADKDAMRTSLAMKNWEVTLASSARNVQNQSNSYTIESPVAQSAKRNAGQKLLGIRIHFPVESFNSWAMVKPPYEIPAYEAKSTVSDDGKSITAAKPSGDPKVDKLSKFEDGLGIVKNVGVLKAVSVEAYGLNFPHGLSVVLKDQDSNERQIFLGYLNYDGWKDLAWQNPNYVQEVRNREIRIYPMYPKSTPFYKFAGFVVTRDGSNEGGDFIGYVKDVRLIYDKAVIDTERDFDDEGIWQIVTVREDARKKTEVLRFGQQQVLRYLESQKQAKEADFTPRADGASTTPAATKP